MKKLVMVALAVLFILSTVVACGTKTDESMAMTESDRIGSATIDAVGGNATDGQAEPESATNVEEPDDTNKAESIIVAESAADGDSAWTEGANTEIELMIRLALYLGFHPELGLEAERDSEDERWIVITTTEEMDATLRIDVKTGSFKLSGSTAGKLYLIERFFGLKGFEEHVDVDAEPEIWCDIYGNGTGSGIDLIGTRGGRVIVLAMLESERLSVDDALSVAAWTVGPDVEGLMTSVVTF